MNCVDADRYKGGIVRGRNLTVGLVVKNLLPRGTFPVGDSAAWKYPPFWPPDLFAVCATLAKLSGFYAEPGIVLSTTPAQRLDKLARVAIAKREGKKFAEGPRVSRLRQRLWNQLMDSSHELVCQGAGEGRAWKMAASQLLAIADEACFGVGYFSLENNYGVVRTARDDLIRFTQDMGTRLNLPNSLTLLVPADECCVLPKAMTPEVGCTIRNLSHNLALLPGVGQVQTEWWINLPPVFKGSATKRVKTRKADSLNLLLIPFPFEVRTKDFRKTRPLKKSHRSKGVDGYFRLRQGWLKNGTKDLSGSELAKFVRSLVEEAEREVGTIQGIVFPEAALTQQLALSAVQILARDCKSLEFVIAGVLTKERKIHRNEAVFFRTRRGEVTSFRQAKHHRWRLNKSQLEWYGLAKKLDPRIAWWEDITVSDRKIQFSIDEREGVIAALICEDLARYEPVLPAISAIGPSLVVALLMDGPQLKARWSGRYATVLAEDPGSAVLTLTSLGMIALSDSTHSRAPRIIGLWKDRDGNAEELVLPPRSQALVLSIESTTREQKTLDLRSDGEAVVEYRFGGVHAISLKSKNIPNWLER